MYNSDLSNKNIDQNKRPYFHAIDILKLGWSVTPPIDYTACKGKTVRKWGQYQREFPTLDQVRTWAGSYPNNNYGVITGKLSGIVCVDADDLEAEVMVSRRCPFTPIMQTTARGVHRIYRYPDFHVGQTLGVIIDGKGYKIDVKGEGNYFIGPGSINGKTGKRYTPTQTWTRELIAQAPVYDPAWLGISPKSRPSHLKPPQKRSNVPLSRKQQAAKDWLLKRSGAIQGQSAGNYTFALAISLLWGFELEPDEALPVMLEWGEQASNVDSNGNYYPWTEDEIRHKLEDAYGIEDGEGKPFGWGLKGLEFATVEAFYETKAKVNVESLPQTELDENVTTSPTILNNIDTSPVGATINPINTTKEKNMNYTSEYSFSPVSIAEFSKRKFELDWLVTGIAVNQQPAIVGGPKKSLKTSVLMDLALSLGSGTDFLDKFPVAKKRVCVFISGESGESTLQETANRIRDNKKIDYAKTSTYLDFRLPKLSVTQEITNLSLGLAKMGAEVVIIDPLYLCLLSGQVNNTKSASNLYDMGPILYDVASACLTAGATPILVHHARKNTVNTHHTTKQPLELEDLAFAGVQEFARQWILINRRNAYTPGTGVHELWFGVGGSAGHSGLWALDVSEGVLDGEFKGRTWNVDVRTLTEVKSESKSKKIAEARTKKHEQDYNSTIELLESVYQWNREESEPTEDRTRRLCGWNKSKFDRIIELTLRDGTLTSGDRKVLSVTKKGTELLRSVLKWD